MSREMLNNIKNCIKKNDELAYKLKILNIKLAKLSTKYMSDEEFIIKQYKRRTGKKLDIKNPKTFNEKLQWLKLNYRNPLLNKCVDKYAVREYVSNKVGEDILIPIYGIYDKIEDVDFSQLPNEFIMKLTNGSSFNYICLEKNENEIKKINNRFKRWINVDYYAYGREWAYKGVKNRIVCEELLKPSSGNPPEDYRFFCFNGKVKAISIDFDSVNNGVKNSNYKRNIYDVNWSLMDVMIEYPNKKEDVAKPKRLNDMIKFAEKLSEDFPEVRVDFYYFDEKIYFGELTFYHSSGYQNFQPRSFELQMGDWIKLENLSEEYKNE